MQVHRKCGFLKQNLCSSNEETVQCEGYWLIDEEIEKKNGTMVRNIKNTGKFMRIQSPTNLLIKYS